MKRNQPYFWPLLALMLIGPFFIGIFASGPPLDAKDLVFDDLIDQRLIVAGLERTHTFSDTLKWWTGPWVDGWECAFYRPITSYIWWIQWQLFGASRYSQSAMISFMAVHWISHFIVCLLLGGFLRRLLGERIAIITAMIWAGCVLNLLKLPVPMWAIKYWKDSPDFWVSGAIICSLWSLLSYLRTGKKRFVIWAFVAQFLAIGFKEMAYVLPFMAVVLLWFEHGQLDEADKSQRRGWPVVAGMFVVVALAYVYRFWALKGPGFRFGTNGSWFERFLLNVGGGKPMYMAIQGDIAPIAVGMLIVAVVFFSLRKRKLALAFAASGAVGILIADFLRGEWGNTLYRLLQPLFATYWYSGFELFYVASIATVTFLSVLWAWRQQDRRMLFAFGWVFAAYLPLLTAPITDHALYLPAVGWAIFWTIVVSELIKRLWEMIGKRAFPIEKSFGNFKAKESV